MKAISRGLSRFCYNHPRLGIPQLMKYIALGNVFVYVADLLTQGMATMLLGFYPGLILRGQVWRLVSFVFVPVITVSGIWGPFFFALTTYFYYWIGTALERQWGTTRFTVFYGLGVVFNIAVGFVNYLILAGQITIHMGQAMSDPQVSQIVTDSLLSLSTASMHYVNMSMFFSFATLYPDLQVMLYGIIPLKVKWLAWLDALFFTWSVGSALMARQWYLALMPVIAILNYLFFFWEDLFQIISRGSSRVRHRTSAQTINFKKAQKDLQNRRGYLHKCAVCGITDADDPSMEFRYCSKCIGYYSYCMKHINDHVHVQ